MAEDDEVTQQIVKSMLSGIGDVTLTLAGDGRAALEAALTQPFDLMIFDQNMPHINGDRVIRHLRAGNSINRDARVIRFTAEAEAIREPAPGTDGDIIVPKPIRGAEFIAVIQNLIQSTSAKRENTAA
ncbi:MAG: response regulator [Rhodobacterales bacterium]|nr:response regulator [Rhodobacterales bacterium]